MANNIDFNSSPGSIHFIKTGKPEQTGSATYTENGSYQVLPEDGYSLSEADITVNVQPSLQDKTQAPATMDATVVPDSGYYGLKSVTVKGVDSSIDENIVAANIKSGVSILGVEGTLTPDVPSVETPLNVTPSTTSQTFSPAAGVDGFNPVTVNAVTSAIDSNIKAENIRSGVSILGVDGTVEEADYDTIYENLEDLNAGDPTISFQVPEGMIFRESTFTSLSGLDTSNRVNFSRMFYSCGSLQSLGELNTSNGTDFSSMFYGCRSLLSVPSIDTSNGTNFANMFYLCKALSTIPALDTSNGTLFSSMFESCSGITTIESLNFSSAEGLNWMFSGCTSLTNITLEGSINVSITFANCASLSYDSVKSILTAASKTTNTDAKTLTFNVTLTDQDSELANLVSNCTALGWTISGLTLN